MNAAGLPVVEVVLEAGGADRPPAVQAGVRKRSGRPGLTDCEEDEVSMSRTPGPRLAKLERLARERPCLGCGRPPVSQAPSAPVPDWDRLTADEERELAGILATGATPACARCGRSNHDLSRLTDDQLDRTLRLLRVLLGPTVRDHAGISTEGKKT